MQLDHELPVTPEYSCFGGWHNVADPARSGESLYVGRRLAVRAAGAGERGRGRIFRRLSMNLRNCSARASAAILIAAGIYWAATCRYGFSTIAITWCWCRLARLCSRLRRSRKTAGHGSRGICDDARDGLDVAGRDVCVSARAWPWSSRPANELETREFRAQRSMRATRSTAGTSIGFPSTESKRWSSRGGNPDDHVGESRTSTPSRANRFAGMEVVRRLNWPGPFGLGRRRYFYASTEQNPVAKN